MKKTKEELLKIYSAYLPYELEIEFEKKFYPAFKEKTFLNFSNIKTLDFWINSKKERYKITPILYSMDMLTKEIEYNGERFVPLHRLLEEYCFDLSKMHEEEILSYAESLIEVDMSYTTFKLLTEWHFNVFGLDESEYIKKESLNRSENPNS